VICKNCGAEFNEGVFCPECGTKFIEDEPVNITKKCPNCGAEFSEGIFCPECGTRVDSSNEETGKESSTANIFGSTDSNNIATAGAEKAQQDAATINSWIEMLSRTKKQSKRQKLLAELPTDTITDPEALTRLAKLKEKVNVPEPKGVQINRYLGWCVLLLIVISSVMRTNDLAWVIMEIGGWAFWIWLIWKIVLVIKSKSKASYLYLKDI